MKRLSSPVRRTLIRLSYLMPAITGLVMLIYACIPHIYFLYEDTVYETLSSFSLIGNTFSECRSILSGTAQGSTDAIFFAYIMMFFVILFWVSILIYTVMAVSSAVFSCRAFSYGPLAKESNRAKRWMQFFCPNRVLYVLSNLMILLAAAFPHILLHFYRSQLGYFDMSIHFFGISDLLFAGILVICVLVLFLALLPAQSEERMDMFRLYKAKK